MDVQSGIKAKGYYMADLCRDVVYKALVIHPLWPWIRSCMQVGPRPPCGEDQLVDRTSFGNYVRSNFSVCAHGDRPTSCTFQPS